MDLRFYTIVEVILTIIFFRHILKLYSKNRLISNAYN